jgi:putative glutamine amidotransferase
MRHYARHLDGLVLQGGADVSPMTYSEAPTRPEWSGDRARDVYELELLHEFVDAGKPVLGICRGCQLINVAFGGTLYQDVATNVPGALAHVHDDYDAHRHAIVFPPAPRWARCSPTSSGRSSTRSTTRPSRTWAATSTSRRCRTRTASSKRSATSARRFVMGLQWHPEFHRAGGVELLDCTPHPGRIPARGARN